jgi:hypothetical protein
MYALLIYRDPATWNALSAEQRAAVAGEHDAFRRSVPELVLTESFAHPAETTTIRARGDATIAVTGPYVDTPAHLCGYYLVDCVSRDRAIQLACRLPDARYAAVEVRELTDPH